MTNMNYNFLSLICNQTVWIWSIVSLW
uniref:Uncharacterized protein n=1 Tax=Rhizophora mucronata TaxID=61149 RepID=A0A2P2PDR6_RHIMU